ncbi:MAG: aminoacyl-histidine dipeptidase [Rikenellaceae bacterium]|jgi:dipeptidase D|nr:aminoacyl-histidine dipeptidase [Rikenellaceae bacterium]
MEKNILSLEPKALWGFFGDVCSIPHPSGHEAALRDYVVTFAQKNNIDCTVDTAGNVILRKPATPGMESRKGIILQAHLDMVPQKNGDKVFDFEKDAIEPYVDGEWVRARGTTLGADNGVGLAAILAVFAADDIKHGPVEALLTVAEETGMYGAFGLKAGLLEGDILMNLDSEDEGELYVGCAGGLDANITFNYKESPAPEGFMAVKLEVKGLLGGHSGIQIVTQRANANKLLFRFLDMQSRKGELLLASVDGGGLRNAIPREATAVALVPAARVAEVLSDAKEYLETVTKEFEGIEEGISFAAAETETPATVIASGLDIIRAIHCAPNGVIRMSASMEGLVQTSTNLARVASDAGKVKIQCLLRSSVNSEKDDLGMMFSSLFELAGAEVELSGAYDGWNPNMESPILHTMIESYERLYGRKPAVMAIHAGLECGIIGGPYPNLDMISFGPTIRFPHSPDEKVETASVQKFWDFLCFTLGNAPEK